MNKRNISDAQHLICTMGKEPLKAVAALRQLIGRGYSISEITLIYTVDSEILSAVEEVRREISLSCPSIHYNAIIVGDERGNIKDFRNEADLRVLLHTLYQVVQTNRSNHNAIHLCISGGRKVMGILAMVAAQLLFGPDDHVWHVVIGKPDPGCCQESTGHDAAWMIPIPVLRMNEMSLLLQTVSEAGGLDSLVEWQKRLENNALMRRRKEFVQHWLTRAEREVLRLVCQGLDNATIASLLHKKPQTVANQLTPIFEKYREWQGDWDANLERSRLVAEFAPYFTLLSEID